MTILNGDGLHNLLTRKEGISNAHPARHTAMRALAENLSLRNVDQSVCELMNEALGNLIALMYEEDLGGLCNVDGSTGRILVPLPWGRNGHRQWGLRPQESEILRQILFDWQYPGPSLFTYHRTQRSWYLNLYDYETLDLAKRWLVKHQVTITVYRQARAKRLGGGVSGG